MALFNYAAKEVTLKIVYYGPGLSGKTTNLQHLHSSFNTGKTGKLISLATETDRTLFFDFLPIEMGKIKDFSVRFQLYTVPGQIKYNLTRRAVLKGADAVVFVADSQKAVREANIESFANMIENLFSNNLNPENIVLVLQYNKRDLPNILSIDELNKDLNSKNHIYIEAEAINGKGVEETFQTAIKLLINDLSQRHKLDIKAAASAEEPRQAVSEEIAEEPVYEEAVPMAEEAITEEQKVIPIEDETVPREKEAITAEKEEVFSFTPELTLEPTSAEKAVPPSQSLKEEIFPEEDRQEPEKPKTKEPHEAVAIERPVDSYQPSQEPVFVEEEKPEPEKSKTEESPSYSSEQLDSITESLRENTEMLAGIKSAINELRDELKKSRKEQEEVLDLLKEIKINEAIERLKEKTQKGWLAK